MNIDKDKLLNEENLVGPDVIARLFGFDGTRRIDQLVSDGVLRPKLIVQKGKEVRKYDLAGTIQDYIAYLKRRADKRTSNMLPGALDDGLRKAKAEADLKEQQAKIEKMKADEYEGILHRSEDIKDVIGDIISRIRAELLALPGSLATDVTTAQTPAEAAGIIKIAVNDLLNHLTQYKYSAAEFKKRVRQREKWMNEHPESTGDDEQ